MASTYTFYLNHIFKQTGYRATWEPGKPLELGQVGKLGSDGVFTVFSTLQDEGITMVTNTKGTGGDLDYTSNDNVTITAKVAGTAPALGSALTEAEAGVSIEFKNSQAIVFQSAGNKTDYIQNLGLVIDQILAKYNNGSWPKDYLVITELTRADSATIIISQSRNGSMDLKAKTAVGAGAIKLTDASLGLTVSREKGSNLKYISQSGLTPLYRVYGIRNPWFGNASVEVKSIAPKVYTAADFKQQDVIAEELEENED
jgi:hypothetical protein